MNHSKIKIIWLKKNKRAGFCRNLAMRKSKLEYIAFIDSDDIWEKEKLFNQLDFMIKNKYYFTYTNYLLFRSEEKQNNLRITITKNKDIEYSTQALEFCLDSLGDHIYSKKVVRLDN